MSNQLTRRNFVKHTAAATAGIAGALASSKAHGANDRIRLGFIGVGNRGGQLIKATLPNKDMEIVGLCDTYAPYLDRWREELGGNPAIHSDFRELLDRDDIDGVLIATPDHWHALQTIMACDAGKDVYIEKPLSITVEEGQNMVRAARRAGRIVQVGVHRRSSPMYAQLGNKIREGYIGKVTMMRAYRLNNMYPDGIGRRPDAAPPKDLDWNMWLGPRAERPFRDNIAPYKFRWWNDYSSQLGNWGVHYFDLLRWLVGEDAPVSVSAHGGRFAVNDDRDIPDTLECTYEFASGRLLLFGQYEASGYPMFPNGHEIELRGTQGIIHAGARGWEAIPERGGQFQDNAPRIEPYKVKSQDGDVTALNIRNWLDCIRSRKRPNADVEDGHLSTVFSHLGNIALATQSRIEWDPKKQRITNSKSANELLRYEYREPWNAVYKHLTT